MYRGFQLVDLVSEHVDCRTGVLGSLRKGERYEKWKKLILSYRSKVNQAINCCFLEDGSIDGSKMQENWFPQIRADVFISHSHGDEILARKLSYWLYVTFGLRAFIDSDVWGYAPDLEEKLLRIYCRYSDQEDYDDLKNFVSAHVHMMLSVALNQMIDNAECLFFLNTPSSISIDAPIEGTTPSPWIYSEIAMSRLIRKKSKGEHRGLLFESEQDLFADRPIRYTLPMDHLTKLNSDDLLMWKKYCKAASHHHLKALDCLYQLNPLKKDE